MTAILDDIGVRAARRLGFTLDTASYASVQRFQRLCPQPEIVDFAWDLRQLRMVKSAEEMAIMRAPGRFSPGAGVAAGALLAGISELAFSAAMEYAFRRQGHDALIRCRREGMEMSASGLRCRGAHAVRHEIRRHLRRHRALAGGSLWRHRAPIPAGEPILLDFAFVLHGYHLDQTRMACWGDPPAVVRGL